MKKADSFINKVVISVIAGLVVLGGVFFCIHSASAITISELNVEINADPGDMIERTVQIYDESKLGMTIYPAVYNFTQDPNLEGTVLLITRAADMKPDRNWIKYDVESIELPADGTLVEFKYRIEVPADGDPGTHLLSMAFQSKPPLPEGQEGVFITVGSRVAANIFLKVSGIAYDEIEADFQVGAYTNTDPDLTAAEKKEFFQPKWFFLKPPVDFLVTVDNLGTTHQKPDGNIRIQNDLTGKVYDKIDVNQDNLIILPGTERTLAVDSFGQGFMFGKYRAQLTLVYGEPLSGYNKTVTFWIIPIWEILIALAILLAIIVIIILLRRRAGKKRDKRDKEKEKKLKASLQRELVRTLKRRVPKKVQREQRRVAKVMAKKKTKAAAKIAKRPTKKKK
ncbi:MAG: hypothetical protein V1838_02390 [Patescibacteria group bacterium]